MARGDTLFRQWNLLKTLQANRFGLHLDELAARLECNRRTVQRDLTALQRVFPIYFETRELGRRYWRIRPEVLESESLQLTVTEMLSLFLSQQLLLPLSGTQFGEGLRTAIEKIRALLPPHALEHFEGLDDAYFIKSLAHHDYSGQDRQIRTLNEAIRRQEAVRVVYLSASKGREVISELHPYGMVLLHAALYCIGFLETYGEVRTLKVARLQSLTPLGRRFDKPATFSLASHFQGAFGVFQTGEARPYEVAFTGWAMTNVREATWHPTQAILQDDGEELRASFELGNTVEFKRWLLGFGRHARVLRPAAFAEEVRAEHEAAAAR